MRVSRTDKPTDLRAIPEDWDCTRICDAAAPTANAIVGGPFGSDLVSSDYEASGTPVIRGQNMSQSVVSGEFVFVSPRKAKSLNANLARPYDLVFTQRGTLGQVSLVPERPFDNYVISQSQMKITLDRSRHDPAFVRHYFASGQGQKQILDSAIQTGVPHTNLGILRAYHFPAPSLREERVIAEALSDVDELLGRLDALIAKKRAIKQATMQQLLTGRTRLPGFGGAGRWKRTEIGQIPEDWRFAHIPDLVARGADGIKIGPFGSALKKEFLRAGGYKVYGQENLFESDMTIGDRYIDAGRFSLLRTCEVRPGDFLISMMGTVGKCIVAPPALAPGIMDSHLLRLRLDKTQILSGFLLYVFRSRIVSDQLRRLSVGGIMEGLSSSVVRRVGVAVPELLEQAVIAKVLSDFDAEIFALESRHDKTRAIKQGMMQQLLTGRVRLVKPAPAEASA